MGIYALDFDGSGFNTSPLVRTPRLTVRCEYPDTGSAFFPLALVMHGLQVFG